MHKLIKNIGCAGGKQPGTYRGGSLNDVPLNFCTGLREQSPEMDNVPEMEDARASLRSGIPLVYARGYSGENGPPELLP